MYLNSLYVLAGTSLARKVATATASGFTFATRLLTDGRDSGRAARRAVGCL
jgi:hypothetical protein